MYNALSASITKGGNAIQSRFHVVLGSLEDFKEDLPSLFLSLSLLSLSLFSQSRSIILLHDAHAISAATGVRYRVPEFVPKNISNSLIINIALKSINN